MGSASNVTCIPRFGNFAGRAGHPCGLVAGRMLIAGFQWKSSDRPGFSRRCRPTGFGKPHTAPAAAKFASSYQLILAEVAEGFCTRLTNLSLSGKSLREQPVEAADLSVALNQASSAVRKPDEEPLGNELAKS